MNKMANSFIKTGLQMAAAGAPQPPPAAGTVPPTPGSATKAPRKSARAKAEGTKHKRSKSKVESSDDEDDDHDHDGGRSASDSDGEEWGTQYDGKWFKGRLTRRHRKFGDLPKEFYQEALSMLGDYWNAHRLTKDRAKLSKGGHRNLMKSKFMEAFSKKGTDKVDSTLMQNPALLLEALLAAFNSPSSQVSGSQPDSPAPPARVSQKSQKLAPPQASADVRVMLSSTQSVKKAALCSSLVEQLDLVRSVHSLPPKTMVTLTAAHSDGTKISIDNDYDLSKVDTAHEIIIAEVVVPRKHNAEDRERSRVRLPDRASEHTHHRRHGHEDHDKPKEGKAVESPSPPPRSERPGRDLGRAKEATRSRKVGDDKQEGKQQDRDARESLKKVLAQKVDDRRNQQEQHRAERDASRAAAREALQPTAPWD